MVMMVVTTMVMMALVLMVMVVGVAMTVAVTPVVAMQFIGDLGQRVERPVVAVAFTANDGVHDEIGANANCNRAAIGLRLGIRTGSHHRRQGKRCSSSGKSFH